VDRGQERLKQEEQPETSEFLVGVPLRRGTAPRRGLRHLPTISGKNPPPPMEFVGSFPLYSTESRLEGG
jgi:hypothetical protein